jgi:hypothetical protein
MEHLHKIETLGSYYPAFFNMRVYTDTDLLDINALNERDRATFFHEYVHFLQDLFTIYGVRNVANLVNYFYQINQHFLEKKKIEIPFKDFDENVEVDKQLNVIYFGTGSFDNIDNIISYSFEKNGDIPGFEDIEFVNIDCTRFINNEKDSFYFGAHHVLESLVYYIEAIIFGEDNHPIYPYKIVDLIIDNFFKELNLNKLCRIVLCEESLHSTHPGRTLFSLLNRVKVSELEFNTPEELHAFCRKDTYLMDAEERRYNSVEECLLEMLDVFKKNVSGYFPDSKILKIQEWINKTHSNVIEELKNGFSFYKLAEFDYLINIFNKIGGPLIQNNLRYYFHNPDLEDNDCDIAIFKALGEFLEIVLGQKVNCDLKGLCSLRPQTVTVNENCDFNPWLNSKREYKCYFGIICWLWGLEDFVETK